MINIKVNNTTHQFATNSSLEAVLNGLSIPANGIAVAINQTIIAKNDWDTTRLIDGDHLLIITATQGG
ncbi:sulfur carrier protein ThiS [Psychroserpens sp. NJDZ02]|uniref:sulfur carrier protein ThiS n=1 Tax=Psychroserpens sp. NJDZ02 TaxID=2570561 RepID=UPI0010A8DE79|nr:sulfur carrier protein ThiS [Psychroserpens sp. NJDZ02]QCE42971.1 sulfur carrier protein ThiS [Psychroserpens sp. NJDZ02]